MTDPDDIDLPDDWTIDIAPPDWYRDVRDVAEVAAAQCRSGEATSVGVVLVLRSGRVQIAYAGGPAGKFHLLAGATYLQAALVGG